jgi:hypothetical protein
MARPRANRYPETSSGRWWDPSLVRHLPLCRRTLDLARGRCGRGRLARATPHPRGRRLLALRTNLEPRGGSGERVGRPRTQAVRPIQAPGLHVPRDGLLPQRAQGLFSDDTSKEAIQRGEVDWLQGGKRIHVSHRDDRGRSTPRPDPPRRWVRTEPGARRVRIRVQGPERWVECASKCSMGLNGARSRRSHRQAATGQELDLPTSLRRRGASGSKTVR